MTSTTTDFGERMLNAAATQAIRHLFSQSESVEVSVRCFPSSKLLQGSIDSFKMQGKGLVIRRQFEVVDMAFETDAVAIDFASALAGKLRLKQPTQAIAQVTLSEAGINRAFRADLVTQHLHQVKAAALMALSGGEPISFQDVWVKLLPNNRIQIGAKADLPEQASVPLCLTATIAVEKRRRIVFQNIVSQNIVSQNPEFDGTALPDGLRDLSQQLTQAFATILNQMVDLDRFDLDGVTVRINRLETQGDRLIFSGYAQIDRFPGSLN